MLYFITKSLVLSGSWVYSTSKRIQKQKHQNYWIAVIHHNTKAHLYVGFNGYHGIIKPMNILALLLFLLVSLPAVTSHSTASSSGDVSKKNATAMTAGAISQYQANHQGRLPDTTMINYDFVAAELKPTDIPKFTYTASGVDRPDTILVNLGKKCDGSSDSPRSFSISTILDDKSRYCYE